MTSMTTGIANLTTEETGWKRLDGNSMQWTGPPEAWGRDLLQVLARRRQDTGGEVLLIQTGNLDEDGDPADAEAVAEAFEFYPQQCELPRPAVVVLHSMLGAWLRATDNAPKE
jgi:hypothetical protein